MMMLSSPLIHDEGFESYGAIARRKSSISVLTSPSFDDEEECKEEQHRGSVVAVLLLLALAIPLLWSDERASLLFHNNATSAASFSKSLSRQVGGSSYASVPKQTNNQSSAPCIFHDVRCGLAQDKVCYLNPLEYELCMEGIGLDSNHVLQTIQSLDDIFHQYYVFYDIARNPMATPHAEQDKIYTNQFDLHGHLQNLTRHILQKGASVATFWDLAESFHRLRDAHVTALQGKLGHLNHDFFSGIYDFVVLPETHWNRNRSFPTDNHTAPHTDATFKLQTNFYFDADHTIQLNVQRYNGNQTAPIEHRVAQIDGLSPHTFLLRLAHSTAASGAYKSVGPRINGLVKGHFPTRTPQQWFFQWHGRRVRPSHIPLPERFQIDYYAAERETMYSKIAVPLDDWREIIAMDDDKDLQLEGTVAIDTAQISEKVNEPGCMYRHFTHFQNTIKRKSNTNSSSRRLRRNHHHQSPPIPSDTAVVNEEINTASWRTHGEPSLDDTIIDYFCDTRLETWFTKAYNCSGFEPPFKEDGPLEVAFKVLPEDGYTIFKIDSFDAPPDIIFPLWREMSQEAIKAGADKLIVDISYNGGGEVPMGLHLARLMYPEVDCEQFDNKYDMVYNKPMQVWAQKVHPLLNNLRDTWPKLSDYKKRQIAVALSSRAQYTKDFLHLVEAMCILDLDYKVDYCGPMEAAARQNCSLYAAAASLAKEPEEMSSLDLFVEQLLEFIGEANPWSEASRFGVSMDVGKRVRVRDGTNATFTEYLAHEPDYPIWWECAQVPVLDNNPFSSYVLVGSGNSGSTANTFHTTVEQIWKHRDLSGATRPLVTVSFGGLPDDTPLTQFAGGTVDDRVNVEDPFVGLLGLQLLSFLFPASMTQGLDEAVALLKESLPEVPYYLNKFPRLTAFEVYNKFMLDGEDEEAMPLEFVFMTPDEHIEAFFPGTIFEGSEGLETLYQKASLLFA